ncbi:hypothetical protein [Maridesulfovibrio sp.]|uniref:hypothetical protein n=1 Tax=Maridesulfovibrio sp. TaxID=2795000 RepID=UPI002A188FCB|nr:hypothetical protein [Maridesulfovibrio sp.]
MKSVYKLSAALFLTLFLASAAFAASQSPMASQSEQDEFRVFAATWVNKLNRSHIKGFHNMEIVLLPDGQYLARYHHIDPVSISCKVKKTSSKKKGMVGLLKYIETIYESTGETPQIARSKQFKPVKNIRITEIFSNTGKGWR